MWVFAWTVASGVRSGFLHSMCRWHCNLDWVTWNHMNVDEVGLCFGVFFLFFFNAARDQNQSSQPTQTHSSFKLAQSSEATHRNMVWNTETEAELRLVVWLGSELLHVLNCVYGQFQTLCDSLYLWTSWIISWPLRFTLWPPRTTLFIAIIFVEIIYSIWDLYLWHPPQSYSTLGINSPSGTHVSMETKQSRLHRKTWIKKYTEQNKHETERSSSRDRNLFDTSNSRQLVYYSNLISSVAVATTHRRWLISDVLGQSSEWHSVFHILWKRPLPPLLAFQWLPYFPLVRSFVLPETDETGRASVSVLGVPVANGTSRLNLPQCLGHFGWQRRSSRTRFSTLMYSHTLILMYWYWTQCKGPQAPGAMNYIQLLLLVLNLIFKINIREMNSSCFHICLMTLWRRESKQCFSATGDSDVINYACWCV